MEGPSPGHVYFAIAPDAGALVEAERTTRRLQTQNRLAAAPLPPQVVHVSLLGIGSRPLLQQQAVDAACAAAAAVKMPAFDVAFDRAASFVGRPKRPLVLFGGEGVIGVEMLQRALISALGTAGFRFRKRAYEPHMTLLYDDREVAEQFIIPIRWRVREFTLVHSLHGLARHVRLARWPLTG